jgi:putative ABC transport system substrate-binding protein
MDELEKNGIVEGKNLTVNRTAIDFDVEKAGIWKKMGVLMRIKKEASRIVDAKPDLVLTIGTPATKYAEDKIITAGIPLVFTGVAVPEAAGCKSLSEAGPGFTGATLYTDMTDSLKIIRLAFPGIKTLGIVYSDDDNAIALEKQAGEECPALGMALISKEVEKFDPVASPAEELIGQGAQAFVMPLDSYYGLKNYEACTTLGRVTLENKMPMISLVHYPFPGCVFYVGADFSVIGSYSGQHAVKILKQGA